MDTVLSSEFSLPRISPALVEDVIARLGEMDLSVTSAGSSLTTVEEHLDRAAELNHAENHQGAYDLTVSASELFEREHPDPSQEPMPEFLDRLDLNACLIVRADLLGDQDAVSQWLGRRRDLLALCGLAEQQTVESQLGAAAFKEPREEDRERILAATESLEGHSWAANLLFLRALVLADLGQHEDALAVFEDLVPAFSLMEDPRGVSQVRFRSLDSLIALGREEEAMDEMDILLDTEQPRLIEAMVRLTRSRLLFGAPSRTAEAVLDALGALELFSAAGIRHGAIVTAMLLHQELAEAQEQSAATAALKVALENAERDESELAPGLHVELGASLLKDGRAAEAVEALAGYLATVESAKAEEAVIRANGYNFLGHAQAQEGNLAGAAAAWTQAHERFSTAEQNEAAIEAAVNIAKVSLASDPEQARTWADSGLELLQRTEMHPLRASELLISLAEVHAQLKNEDAIIMVDKAIELAREFEALLHEADFTENKARILRVLGREDEAIALVLNAADLFGEAAQPTPASRCELWAGILLLKQEKLIEAVTVFRTSLDRSPDAAAKAEINERLAYALDGLGQHVEAREAREAAEFWSRENDEA